MAQANDLFDLPQNIIQDQSEQYSYSQQNDDDENFSDNENTLDQDDIIFYQYFTIKEVTQMMNKYKFNKRKFEILNNQIIEQYCKYYDIELNYNIKNYFQNNWEKQTVAMWLAKEQCIIPKQWMHEDYIKNKYGETLKDIMLKNNVSTSDQWQKKQKMTIFDQAYFGIIPYIEGHKLNEQNEDGYTIAMLLAMTNRVIPKEWYHDPSIQDKKGYTVAMYQALRNKIPDQQWHHNPNLQDYYGKTVAMILAEHKIIPPSEWYHKPELQDEGKETVAMKLAQNEIIPPKEWYHDLLLKNNSEDTVAVILINKGVLPPKEWEHIIYKHDINKDSSKQLLLDNGYIEINDYFIPPNVEIFETLNDTCQICFNQGKQEFISTICGHNICKECFKQLCKSGNYKSCPICRIKDWIYIQQLDQDYDNESNIFYDSSDSNNSTSSHILGDFDNSSDSSTFSSNTSSTDSDSNDSTDSSDNSEF